MINNIYDILPLLKFESDAEFYFLQLIQRKKDNNKNVLKNERIVRNYYIKSEEYLLSRYKEIKALCDMFNARASLRLNRRSYKKALITSLKLTADSIYNEEYTRGTSSAFDKACGKTKSNKDNLWIIDVDGEELYYQNEVIDFCNSLEPMPNCNNKYVKTIKSKNGYHIITTPFNVMEFKKKYSLDIHKDNPTNLYIP